MAENENIIIRVIESEPIQIRIAEPAPINTTIVAEVVPSEIKNVFIPGSGGHRVTKLYVKDHKLQVEYEAD